MASQKLEQLNQLLRQLPLRAVVAVLARNARRLTPLFALGPAQDLVPENLAALEDAICAAEAFASGAAEVTDDGSAAFAVAMRCSLRTSPAAFAAALAACAADHASQADVSAEMAGEALAAAVQAFAYFEATLGDEIETALADCQALLANDQGGSAQASAFYDSSESGILGPLWPAGKVPNWQPRMKP